MNNYVGVVENNNTSFNRDIVLNDLEGNVKVIAKCYCTIVKGKSMSYYIDIVEKELFLNNRDAFQVEIDKYVVEAKELALALEVPYIG